MGRGAAGEVHQSRQRVSAGRASNPMMIRKSMIAVLASASPAVRSATAVAVADECEAMSRSIKGLVDTLDPAAKGGDNPARLCAAFGEGLGVIKAFRIVNDECLDEGEERTRLLAGLAGDRARKERHDMARTCALAKLDRSI